MASNESLGCGCKVYQKKLGTTTWNRIDMCSVHYHAKELLDTLKLFSTSYCPSCGCDLANSPGCTWCGLITDARAVIKQADETYEPKPGEPAR